MKNLFTLIILSCFVFNAFSQTITIWHNITNTTKFGSTDRIDDIYFLNRRTGFAAGPSGEIYKTIDSGRTWSKNLTGAGYMRSIEFSDNGKYGIAGTLIGNKVFRTTDTGNTWTDIISSIPDTGANKNRICGLAHQDNKFYGVGWWGTNRARFYRSNDSGQTWTVQLLDSTLATGLVDITFLAPNICLTTGCRYYNGNKLESVVLRSVDTGHTWTKVFADTTIGGRIWKIQFLDNLIGYASVEPYFFKDTVCYLTTNNGGLSWNMHAAGSKPSTNPYAGTQGIGFISQKTGWIGGWYAGYFETNDSCKSWHYRPYCSNFNRFLKIDDSCMYSSGYSVYKFDSLVTVGVDIKAKEPVCSHYLQNVSPNPVKDILNIEFDIAYRTNVVLEVANIANREVYHISSAQMNKGHYKYSWDCSNKAPGEYIIWLGTDEIPLVQKFIILK
jgi:hypothetical protein